MPPGSVPIGKFDIFCSISVPNRNSACDLLITIPCALICCFTYQRVCCGNSGTCKEKVSCPLLVQSGCRLLRILGCAYQHKVSPKPSPDPATDTRAWECQPMAGGGSIPEFCSYFIQNAQGEQGEKTRKGCLE